MADARSADPVTTEQRTRISPIFVIATVLGLALAVIGGVLFVVPSNNSSAGEPSRNVEIVSQVTKFATNYNTYDASDLKDYQQRLDGLLTEEFAEATNQSTASFFKVLEPKQQKSTDPQVKSVAIQSSDADSAQVLVVVDSTVDNTELKEPELRQMRWLVAVQLEDGQWRIDSFQSIGAEPASGTEVVPTTPAPSATATEGGAGQ